MCFANIIVFGQSKGGCGKTTTTTNVAGLLAAAGKRVLVIDLDPQGSTARNFGVDLDDGRKLLESIAYGEDDPTIHREVRTGLDLVPAGRQLRRLVPMVNAASENLADSLERFFARFAADYDYILVDTPPGMPELVTAALASANSLVILQDADLSTLDGTDEVADSFVEAGKRNPELRLLGVILFRIAANATKIRKTMLEAVCKKFGADSKTAVQRAKEKAPISVAEEPVFRTVIRDQARTGHLSRFQGHLVQELADAHAGRAGLWRDYVGGGAEITEGAKAEAAGVLLEDLVAITIELLERFEDAHQPNTEMEVAAS